MQLVNSALGIALFGIVLAIMAYLHKTLQDQFTENTTEWNVTVDTLSGLQTSSSFIPIIAIASVLGVVVLTLLGAFGNFGRTRGEMA